MSSSNLRDLQRELENKANDLSKLQKGTLTISLSIIVLFVFTLLIRATNFPFFFFRNCEESPDEEEVHDSAWRERARPQGIVIIFFICSLALPATMPTDYICSF